MAGHRPGAAKTGGRQAGTPNKRTLDVIATLQALGCDSIEGMARIAMDQGNSPELRGRMFAEFAGYVAPKRKAIDHDLPGESPLALGVIMIPSKAKSSPKQPAVGDEFNAAIE